MFTARGYRRRVALQLTIRDAMAEGVRQVGACAICPASARIAEPAVEQRLPLY
jgi:hypothetical protein